MATPIGHSMLGLALAQFPGAFVRERRWRLYVFAIFAANSPDLDLGAGLILGDINKYHQGPSHSMLAAILFGVLGILFSKWLGLRSMSAYLFATACYASHLLLDYFCADSRAPFGQPLLWPVIDQHWIADNPVFSGILHGVPGDNFMTVIGQIFSMANLNAIVSELLLFSLVAAVWGLRAIANRLDRKIVG